MGSVRKCWTIFPENFPQNFSRNSGEIWKVPHFPFTRIKFYSFLTILIKLTLNFAFISIWLVFELNFITFAFIFQKASKVQLSIKFIGLRLRTTLLDQLINHTLAPCKVAHLNSACSCCSAGLHTLADPRMIPTCWNVEGTSPLLAPLITEIY